MTTMKSKQGFEITTCGRCVGTGRFSYNTIDGDRCYGCQGKRNKYTARGQAAVDYLASLRSRRADQLTVGMIVHTGSTFVSRFAKITAIKHYDNSGTIAKINGVVQPNRSDLLTIEFDEIEFATHGVAPEKVFVVQQTKESAAATLALALAYQDTLDDQGKVDPELVAIARSAASEDRSFAE